MKKLTTHDIAQMIDHSLLQPMLTRQEMEAGCRIAAQYQCATVCVKPCDVSDAHDILESTPVRVTTVIGFPHGSNLTAVKCKEVEMAIRGGCKEVDVVQNIGRLLSEDTTIVEADLYNVVKVAHQAGLLVKVILENAYLTDEQKILSCKIAVAAGADFVKTSTGYGPGGATIHDIRLMRANVPKRVLVKAAGGVRTLDSALAVRAVGASRIGATATVKILSEAQEREALGTLYALKADDVPDEAM
ncbi:MAG: deoxyribose-phosphate aldolase [Lachnospiraceae bacterium]|jgi:deoxyribose-phosphate aldolase|nr:deoxyribose-phosphate aldolase [Lachnospiraceae bacterium]